MRKVYMSFCMTRYSMIIVICNLGLFGALIAMQKKQLTISAWLQPQGSIFQNAHCTDSAQNQQKIVSKTWLNLTCLTLANWEQLLESPRNVLHKWIDTLESSEIVNFWWKFLLWLACNIISHTIRQYSLSHCL